jgi:hypothetical protein
MTSLNQATLKMQVLSVTNETLVIRNQAASYAKGFLAKKYYEEYQELYDAYLINRGISIRRNKNLIDERQVRSQSESITSN